jgi:uncharacterized protein (DUF1015 family)
LNTAEAREMAKENQRSFLFVNKPEIALDESQDPYSQEVYDQGKAALDRFIRHGHLKEDNVPRMYIYKMQMGSHI